jgi:hypothetical protein
MAAIEAAGGGAEHAVMAGIMAGHAADDGTLDAALRVGGGSGSQRKDGDGNSGECDLHDGYLRTGIVAHSTATIVPKFHDGLALLSRDS